MSGFVGFGHDDLDSAAALLTQSTERARRSASALGAAFRTAQVESSAQPARSVQAEQNLHRDIEDEFGLLSSVPVADRMGSRAGSGRRNAADHRPPRWPAAGDPPRPLPEPAGTTSVSGSKEAGGGGTVTTCVRDAVEPGDRPTASIPDSGHRPGSPSSASRRFRCCPRPTPSKRRWPSPCCRTYRRPGRGCQPSGPDVRPGIPSRAGIRLVGRHLRTASGRGPASAASLNLDAPGSTRRTMGRAPSSDSLDDIRHAWSRHE